MHKKSLRARTIKLCQVYQSQRLHRLDIYTVHCSASLIWPAFSFILPLHPFSIVLLSALIAVHHALTFLRQTDTPNAHTQTCTRLMSASRVSKPADKHRRKHTLVYTKLWSMCTPTNTHTGYTLPLSDVVLGRDKAIQSGSQARQSEPATNPGLSYTVSLTHTYLTAKMFHTNYHRYRNISLGLWISKMCL